MKKLKLLTVYFAPLAFFLTGEAWAFPNILDEWKTKYPSSSSSDLVNCQLCHWNSKGGDPWNDYGWAVRVKYINNERTSIIHAFEDVEGLNSDSDPTSASNWDEIDANTQPGWTAGANNTIHRKDGSFTAGQEPPVELAGIVLDPDPNPDISISPGSVDFALVKIRSSSDAEVQIANIGIPDLEIISIELCEGTSSEFSWAPSLNNTFIASGASETLTVSFSPVDTGPETGCLQINSTDPDQLTETIVVTGEGVKKVPSDGGGKPGGDGGGGGGSKLSLIKTLTAESVTRDDIAQSGEILTYTITVSNGGRKDAFTDVTETVPAATVHVVDGEGFDCGGSTTAGTSCVMNGVPVPGRGSVELFFSVKVDSPFNDIQNTVSATGVDCADPSNTCSTNTPADADGEATQARHLINRISYGITPSQLATMKESSFMANYIGGQLSPTGCLDPAAAQAIGGIFDHPTYLLTLPIKTRNDLQNYAILMAAYNDCQLREVLTQFWDNHFNTDWDAVNSKSGGNASQTTIWELAENDAFRANALGNFRDLVEISAKSPAMIYYLDGVNNVLGAPNENYARELMELHTMSVDGGYTDLDVVNVAIAFTGWTVDGSGNFMCDSTTHDYSDIKLDLGDGPGFTTIETEAPNCEAAGQAVFDELIAHSVTGEFICQKLTELLVNDNMTPAVVSACESVFASSITEPDQIAQVVEAILTSTEFKDTDDYLDKVKTPLELTVGYLRNFDIVNSDVALPLAGDLNDLRSELDQMSMSLFRFNTPDGFPEQSEDWVDSGLMQRRFAFISDMAFNTSATGDIYLNPTDFFLAHTDFTAVQIVDYLMNLVMQNQHTALERDAALAILNNTSGFDGGTDFDTETDAGIKQNRLRTLLAVVLNYPGYQYQ